MIYASAPMYFGPPQGGPCLHYLQFTHGLLLTFNVLSSTWLADSTRLTPCGFNNISQLNITHMMALRLKAKAEHPDNLTRDWVGDST